MGRPKLLLPIGDTTVIELVLRAMRAGGINDVVMVVAPSMEDLARKAMDAGAQVVRLSEDTPNMRATCLHGLAWIEERFHPRDDDGWLLLPADHPTVQPDVVRAILAAISENTDKTIIVPSHKGRRGHPTWLRWSHVAAIRAMPADQGLNAYIRTQSAERLELPWPDDDILFDLDTPEDYRQFECENLR